MCRNCGGPKDDPHFAWCDKCYLAGIKLFAKLLMKMPSAVSKERAEKGRNWRLDSEWHWTEN